LGVMAWSVMKLALNCEMEKQSHYRP
jgi:hypothetical protein